jgi:type IV secretory pathway VirB6-like protein
MTSNAALATSCVTSPIPKPAANTGNFELGTCAFNHTGVNYLPHEVTQKFIACMQGTIVDSVIDIMNVIATEFSWLTGALATLVIMFYGIRVATGERDLLKRTATLMIKLGIVVTMMASLPYLVSSIFSWFQEILTWVTGGVSPWAQIDNFLGKLLGFGATITMLNGLLGVVVAAAFSSSVGAMTAFSGVMAILNLLLFLMNMVYTYCLAFLTLGFLLLLAPVIIPMHLFFYTKEYFVKWFHIMSATTCLRFLQFIETFLHLPKHS